MNIGIRLHDTEPGSLKERLAFARAQGFSCAHVALSKVLDDFAMEDAPEKLTDEYALRVRKEFDESGLECAVLGCYLNLADPNPERRAQTQEIYKAHLRFAAKIGARVVGTETYANPESAFSDPAPQSEEAFRLLLDSLKPVVRCAEECGAVLAVEPVWCHIISTPERAARMLEELPSENLQIILDAVNLIAPEEADRAEDIIRNAISLLGDRVRILHMKDYVITPQGEMDACACGLGSMRYEQLLTFAAARGLPMTLENTVPENAEEARLYLERAAGKL
ncbi:sugar phosphate isomerase/epimerase [Clostridiales bacterium FE2010]|nr:sugar phosphate isomerase/epimerase [Clostridiales bacterium FE2010]